MDKLLKMKELIFGDSSDEYFIKIKNKNTGWIGCASFYTNGENKIYVNEGNPDGSDDAGYTYEEFLNLYDFELKKEVF